MGCECMQDFQGKNIIIGVCGGIAAYKTVELARNLSQLGANIQVVMTASAASFIGAQTFQAITSNPVWMHTNDSSFEQAMAHIELSRWADYVVIAPATANFIAKIAHGLGDDLLSVLCLMVTIPIIVCPAMNVHMWQNTATLENVDTLKRRGIYILGPDNGIQACGDEGLGRMREPQWILHALNWLPIYHILQGYRFVLTAGPTREAIDPVRFISNRSSGLMGFALAEALAFAGATVTLISGPSALPIPPNVLNVPVITADDMYQEVLKHLQANDCFIGVAAVCDFQSKHVSPTKIKKTMHAPMPIDLEPTIDILQTVKASKLAKTVIGFAAETDKVLDFARLKLQQKADMIIANQVGASLGFEQDSLAVSVITASQEIHIPTADKRQVAQALVMIIKEFLEKKE